METNKMSDFVVKSGGRCFLCLSEVSSHLTFVKVEPDVGEKSSSKFQAEQSVFHAKHSFKPLSRYLKLNLGVVLKENNKACQNSLRVKLARSRLTVSLCEGCEILNGKFSELFHQLERIQMEVNHCLSAMRGKLTESDQSINKRLDNRLGREEADILETLRNETMEKCLLKLDRATPRVRLKKLKNKQTFTQITAGQGQVTSSQKLPDNEPALEARTSASVTTEIDSQSEASPQLDVELMINMNMQIKREVSPDSSRGETDKVDSPDVSNDESFDSEQDDVFSETDESSDDDSTKKSTHLPPQSSVEKIHFKRNPSTGKFKCIGCTKEFSQLSSAHAHYRSAHFPCAICKKLYSTQACLNLHHRVVHLKQKPHQCDECGKQFARSGPLQRHREAIHLNLKPYPCDECGSQFSWPSNLRKHRRRKHSNLKPDHPDVSVSQLDMEINSNNKYFGKNPDTGKFKCSTCDEEFASKSSVRAHYRAAHLKLALFQCNICGKHFDQECRLKTHLNIIHLKLKPHQCDECGKQFDRSAKLKIHQREVHLKIKPYKCDHCGKLFGRHDNLKTHVRNVHLKLHEQLKEHQCDNCGKTFPSQWKLTRHQQTVHLKIKRHQCDHCSKNFGLWSDLRIHVENVHKQIKHDCDQCGKHFKKEGHLCRHLNSVHRKP